MTWIRRISRRISSDVLKLVLSFTNQNILHEKYNSQRYSNMMVNIFRRATIFFVIISICLTLMANTTCRLHYYTTARVIIAIIIIITKAKMMIQLQHGTSFLLLLYYNKTISLIAECSSQPGWNLRPGRHKPATASASVGYDIV